MVEAFDGEFRRVRSGRENEVVVADRQPCGGAHLTLITVDAGDGIAVEEVHALIGEHRRVEGEVVVRRTGEERGEADAVVRMTTFFADHRDVPRIIGSAQEALHEPVGDHPGAHDDGVPWRASFDEHVVTVAR